MINRASNQFWIADNSKPVEYVYSLNKEVDTGTIQISSGRQSVWLSTTADNPLHVEARQLTRRAQKCLLSDLTGLGWVAEGEW